MATLFPTIASHTYAHFPNWGNSISSSSQFIFFPCSINHSISSPIHLHRSFAAGPPFNLHRSILRSSLGPPPPPQGRDTQRFVGVAATFSRLWDTVQIFFAVLFWMSLFFWASASDGKNTGRGNKRDRFRE